MRPDAALTQAELAARLNRPQSFVARYEDGERRLDVVEFIEVAEAIGFDPAEFVRALSRQTRESRAPADESQSHDGGVAIRSGRCTIMERMLADSHAVVHSDPDISGGTPVFRGTRVPAQSLFDYLEGGETLDQFLDQFPSVSKEQALAALDLARDFILARTRSA